MLLTLNNVFSFWCSFFSFTHSLIWPQLVKNGAFLAQNASKTVWWLGPTGGAYSAHADPHLI